MDEIKLKPCPFCRRMPKVRYRAFGCCGAWVEVRCKPLFRREHLAVQHGAATMERAVDMAVGDGLPRRHVLQGRSTQNHVCLTSLLGMW